MAENSKTITRQAGAPAWVKDKTAWVKDKIKLYTDRRAEIILTEGRAIELINEELEELQERKGQAVRDGGTGEYCFLLEQERQIRERKRQHCENLRQLDRLIKRGESNGVIDSLREYGQELDRDFLQALREPVGELMLLYAKYTARREDIEQTGITWLSLAYPNIEDLPEESADNNITCILSAIETLSEAYNSTGPEQGERTFNSE